jgi:outer membrane immunogenic protein
LWGPTVRRFENEAFGICGHWRARRDDSDGVRRTPRTCRAATPCRPRRPCTKRPYNWTGFYVGLNGGGGFGHSNWDAFATGFDTTGGLVGGTVGYNYQMGQVVFGLEGDGDWSNLRGSGLCAGPSCETRNNWLATARGRLGYSFGRVMPYVTGGGAFGDIKSSLAGFGSQTTTRAG